MPTPVRGWFHPAISVAIAVVVFAGFAPTFFLRDAALPPLPVMTRVHGVVFTGWIALLAVQVGLVAAGRRDLHRRLGVAGGVLAAAMVALGIYVALASARRGIDAGQVQESLAFLLIPLGDILGFAALAGLALHYRARPEIHRRFMLLASLALLPAAIGRLPWAAEPAGFIPVFAVLLAAAPVHDWRTRGRPHPLSVWGGAALFVSELGRFMVMNHPAWVAVAERLVG